MELEFTRMQEFTAKRTLESVMMAREDYNVFPDSVDCVGFVFCFSMSSGLNECFVY